MLHKQSESIIRRVLRPGTAVRRRKALATTTSTQATLLRSRATARVGWPWCLLESTAIYRLLRRGGPATALKFSGVGARDGADRPKRSALSHKGLVIPSRKACDIKVRTSAVGVSVHPRASATARGEKADTYQILSSPSGSWLTYHNSSRSGGSSCSSSSRDWSK